MENPATVLTAETIYGDPELVRIAGWSRGTKGVIGASPSLRKAAIEARQQRGTRCSTREDMDVVALDPWSTEKHNRQQGEVLGARERAQLQPWRRQVSSLMVKCKRKRGGSHGWG